MDPELGWSDLAVRQSGRTCVLTINNEATRNALSRDVLAHLKSALEAATDDPSVSVVVIHGAGGNFSSGFDLGQIGGRAPDDRDLWMDRERLRRANQALEAVWNCPLPVVAAVEGHCVAGGADLALHCDFLIAAHDCSIGYPAVRNLGAPPTSMWLYRLGPQRAKSMLLTGDSISGRQARDWGLALESWEAEVLMDQALLFAGRLGLISRELLMSNKAVINRGIDLQGRTTLNRIAETEDAIAHLSPAAQQFRATAREQGLRAALNQRDEPFR